MKNLNEVINYRAEFIKAKIQQSNKIGRIVTADMRNYFGISFNKLISGKN